jgi:hypothetical protein
MARMLTWWVSRSSSAPVSRSDPRTEVQSSKGRFEVTMVEQDAVLVGPIYRFGLPCSIRRRFEKLEGFPGGLLPISDLICRFNPAFGQGRVLLRKRWRSSSACSKRELQILIRSMGLRWHSSRRFRKCSPYPGRCAENDFIYEPIVRDRMPGRRHRCSSQWSVPRRQAKDDSPQDSID